MPIELSQTSAAKLDQLPKLQTVFFFPVGPVEDHGPHLPMGLDGMESHKLCWLAAERLEREMPGWFGVVMPAAPLGVSSNTTRYAITVRGHVLRDWLVDACRSMMRAGFRNFVCFSGNLAPRQLTAIEEAGKVVMARGPFTWIRQLLSSASTPQGTRAVLVSASSALASAEVVAESPFWPDPIEHGAKRDTSIALFVGTPLLLEGTALSGLAAQPRSGNKWSRLRQRLRRQTSGYWGAVAPKEANAGWGELTLIGQIDDIFPKLRAILEGANPRSMFRTYYSILPPNQSFFKAWLLALMVFATLMAWIYLTLQGLWV